ncbi:hypothetical protein VF14_11425 [Nostoc linckia z18]|jgi:hypothetical protein|uniref:Uncharacterized protein n=4 Tax=Nostoc linckia TaxID=92942 RepID=A0A9Q5ZG74_NOSLI|nr:hypothetical protein VF02_13480 [Nostoc linckia z1]PHJ69778.1 hypothetical protein VF05_12695 [Nostoc linckia z3]PHJ75895.1 hypothetical protein VF03_09065 [Nostoc linckia z2]PHJ85603.1 hypothetical protein VF06_05080 [Nostoc linckia z4]PHJ88794.1 hypothetical protein VF07_14845 [Nostoc linckia z6]PHK00730.1 hypothetical protein VF04_02230 [Nostoc linckia z7]PHK06600.1 hypothetical protein VF08_03755 [Nostoc linckia z8]PHK10502.1 hypothetical protein VF09_10830 [Nostoc linckia z9]PHK2096
MQMKQSQMQNQNADLHLIRTVLKQLHYLVDAIEAVRLQNAIQDNQLADLENRVSVLETNFGHQVCRNEDLQNLVDFHYPPD